MCVDETFQQTWNHPNIKTLDWLHHKCNIDQMTCHEHRVLTENYDSNESIVVSWDYANSNQAKGVDEKCVEHSSTIGRLVFMVLYSRVSTKSMMDVWRIYSPAKDYPVWNAMALSEIISAVWICRTAVPSRSPRVDVGTRASRGRSCAGALAASRTPRRAERPGIFVRRAPGLDDDACRR